MSGPTTYADLHPGEPSFIEKMAAKNPGTVYDNPKRNQTPDYDARMAALHEDVHSRVNTIPWPDDYTEKTESVFDTIWPNSALSTGGITSSAPEPGGMTADDRVIWDWWFENNTDPFPGWAEAAQAWDLAHAAPSSADNGGSVPGESLTGSALGTAAAAIAALFILSAIK